MRIVRTSTLRPNVRYPKIRNEGKRINHEQSYRNEKYY